MLNVGFLPRNDGSSIRSIVKAIAASQLAAKRRLLITIKTDLMQSPLRARMEAHPDL
jgi:hypothetical protein